MFGDDEQQSTAGLPQSRYIVRTGCISEPDLYRLRNQAMEVVESRGNNHPCVKKDQVPITCAYPGMYTQTDTQFLCILELNLARPHVPTTTDYYPCADHPSALCCLFLAVAI